MKTYAQEFTNRRLPREGVGRQPLPSHDGTAASIGCRPGLQEEPRQERQRIPNWGY